MSRPSQASEKNSQPSKESEVNRYSSLEQASGKYLLSIQRVLHLGCYCGKLSTVLLNRQNGNVQVFIFDFEIVYFPPLVETPMDPHDISQAVVDIQAVDGHNSKSDMEQVSLSF